MNRSVTAAAWSEHWLAQRFVNAEIRSAGTHAYDDANAAASTIEVMHPHGFDLRSHRTTRLTSVHIAWADHVVVMEPMHRDVVLGLSPDAQEKVVPMWPFVEESDEDHVVDPHGGPVEGYRLMALSLQEASKKLVAHILAERRKARQKR